MKSFCKYNFIHQTQMKYHTIRMLFFKTDNQIYNQINLFFNKFYANGIIRVNTKNDLYMYCYERQDRYFIKISETKEDCDPVNIGSTSIFMKYKPERHKHESDKYNYDFNIYNFLIVYSLINDSKSALVENRKFKDNKDRKNEIINIIKYSNNFTVLS